MLLGSGTEQERIRRLLADAREGRSSALVLRGEPGVGKSALLAHARELAGGLTVLSARGLESKAELPFAGLSGREAPHRHRTRPRDHSLLAGPNGPRRHR